MKETGIMMSGNLPKLILDGDKTMTRRTWGLEKVNENPDRYSDPNVYKGITGKWFAWFHDKESSNPMIVKCPYGGVGDWLWVKETWRAGLWQGGVYQVEYKAGGYQLGLCDPVAHNFAHYADKWQPSIHMFKWASRIRRQITGLRAERLQEISLADIQAEGIYDNRATHNALIQRDKFKALWDSLNAKRGHPWDRNDWVWVIRWKE